MNPSHSISKLTAADKPMFVSLMSKAFSNDPLFLYLFGNPQQDSKASSRITAFVSFMFDKSFLLHEEEAWGYFENDRLLGAYIIEKPHASRLQRIKGSLLLAGRLIPCLLQLSGKTFGLLNSYMRATRAAAPSLSHYYLIMIAVRTDGQGRGIGKAMLQHLVRRASEDYTSHGVALDTENKENVGLYRRFGFTLSSEAKVGHLPVYCMFYESSSLS
ncbi:GNAT family N-acetyltransferase [Paenibacillus sp. GCM10027626]|uniref:GNAT family N-acetyltransferase n=1 Tax=Paenibacillus sp. GCM10027626 TaxID=3273411 RepID=UPI00363B2958